MPNPMNSLTHPSALILIISALAVAALIACSSPSNDDASKAEEPAPTSSTPSGRTLFVTNCAGCHGAIGEGQPNWHIRNADGSLPAPPLNGDGHTWHHGDGLLYRVVYEGGAEVSLPGFKTVMPTFAEVLSHEEIIAVINYVKSLWEGKMSRGLLISESQAFASEQDPFPTESP